MSEWLCVYVCAGLDVQSIIIHACVSVIVNVIVSMCVCVYMYARMSMNLNKYSFHIQFTCIIHVLQFLRCICTYTVIYIQSIIYDIILSSFTYTESMSSD